MNSLVDKYLIDGCGRCAFYQTPQCKVHSWTNELKQLRRIVLESGLTEELKWSQPCYTFQNSNILLVTAFKEYAALAFFKGVLLKDAKNILISPGKNSQAVRQVRFTNVKDIINQEETLKVYIHEAIKIEKKGLKIKFNKNPEQILKELKSKFDDDASFKVAFEGLTPGRQRGYILYFSAPKQSQTRIARIEKCTPKILLGEGLNDSYKSMKK